MTETTMPVSKLRKRQPRFLGLDAGHRACAGCGAALTARLAVEAAGPDVVVANATGCLEGPCRRGMRITQPDGD
jgi:pyruvate ferredoxin oxidoreductase beta subunit